MSSDNTYLVVGIIIVSVIIFLTLYAPKKQAELSSSIKRLLTDGVDDLEDIGKDAIELGEDVVRIGGVPLSDYSDTDDSDTDDSDTDDSDTDDDEGGGAPSPDEGGGAPSPVASAVAAAAQAPVAQAPVAQAPAAPVMPSPGAGQEAFTGLSIGRSISGQKTCPGKF